MNDHIEYSDEGNQNLISIQKADKYVDWFYSIIKPFLKGKIVEIGSGIGTYSQKILNDFPGNEIVLSDVDKKYIKSLKTRFGEYNNIIFKKLDLTNETDCNDIGSDIDSFLAMGVLEHIEDDILALKNIHNMLSIGGRLILAVPAYMFMFNIMDEKTGHFRRYGKKELILKAESAGYRVADIFYFNFLALIGWFVNGTILRKEVINEDSMKIYNVLVPFLKILDRFILFRKTGFNLICVLEKTS